MISLLATVVSSCNYFPILKQFKIIPNQDSDFEIETIERDNDHFEVLKDTVISYNNFNQDCNTIQPINHNRFSNYGVCVYRNNNIKNIATFNENVKPLVLEKSSKSLRRTTYTIEAIDNCLMGTDEVTGKEVVKVRKQIIQISTLRPVSES